MTRTSTDFTPKRPLFDPASGRIPRSPWIVAPPQQNTATQPRGVGSEASVEQYQIDPQKAYPALCSLPPHEPPCLPFIFSKGSTAPAPVCSVLSSDSATYPTQSPPAGSQKSCRLQSLRKGPVLPLLRRDGCGSKFVRPIFAHKVGKR